ncbi:MAG: hypothetical protein ACYCS7_02890 [Acidimicrobiales bacterium]
MSAPGSFNPAGGDWPAKAADGIESVVAAVADRTVRPLNTLARGLVYGLVGGVMGQIAVVLVVISLLRLLNVWAFPNRVWASDLLIGAIFVAVGLFLWSKRTTTIT